MKARRVTIIDVAKAAGVSKSTVSLVLQGSNLVNDTTRQKINYYMRELGYVYNRGAATLRQSSSKSKIVGVVVNDLTNGFFAELTVGIDEVMQSAGFVQFISNTGERIDTQRNVISTMREHGIAGLIVSPARGTTGSDLKPFVAAGVPTVLVVRTLSPLKVSSLVSDNTEGAAAATDHLISLGHTRIAFLGGLPDTSTFGQRVNGYRQALAAAGLEFHESLVATSPPSRSGGFDAIDRVLCAAMPPTAAVCFNDAVAFGVYDGLRRCAIEPGVEFAVVGFDDVIEAKTAVPALTTVSMDPKGLGRRAAQLLLKQINSGRADPESVVSPVRLVVRQSSGLPELKA